MVSHIRILPSYLKNPSCPLRPRIENNQPTSHVKSIPNRIVLLLVLLGQTIHILNGSERRYINLRHLLIKWISLVVVIALAESVKKHTSYDEMFELMCNLSAMGMVYPSKVTNPYSVYQKFAPQVLLIQLTEEV